MQIHLMWNFLVHNLVFTQAYLNYWCEGTMLACNIGLNLQSAFTQGHKPSEEVIILNDLGPNSVPVLSKHW